MKEKGKEGGTTSKAYASFKEGTKTSKWHNELNNIIFIKKLFIIYI